MAEKARSSSLFRDRTVVIIPNGIDTNLYCPGDMMEARRELGLPENCRLLLFGSIHALSDTNKGFDLLQRAIDSMNPTQLQNTELIIFGADNDSILPDCNIPVRNLGIVSDEEQMVLLYRAADILVAPSREETLGYVIMEAMSCGTPCVAFEVGGIPDLITHGETGYLARPYIVEDLATGIINVLHDDMLRKSMAEKSRKWIEDNLSLQLIAQRHLKLYRQMISSDLSD
jgi:glycosyltransferase involved in cell wall biosynthesis